MPTATIHWLAIAVVAAATAVSMRVASLSFDWISAVKLAAACAGMQALAWFYHVKRPDERLATTLSLIAKLIAFSAAATLLSYAVATMAGTPWDRTLLSWDQALGLDWFAYLDFMQSHPVLETVCRIAYHSLVVQVFFAVGVLGLSGHLKRAEEFVLSYAIAGLIAVIMSALMPAIAMFVHVKAGGHSGLDLNAPFVVTLKSLRDGSLTHISLLQMEGIITLPSFHTALGVIFGYSFWTLRGLRWVGLVVNALLIAGTPINGGHYFVDVFAGAVVAVVAIWGARRATAARYSAQPSAGTAALAGFKPRPIVGA
jgi:hypothetical protein